MKHPKDYIKLALQQSTALAAFEVLTAGQRRALALAEARREWRLAVRAKRRKGKL